MTLPTRQQITELLYELIGFDRDCDAASIAVDRVAGKIEQLYVSADTAPPVSQHEPSSTTKDGLSFEHKIVPTGEPSNG